MLIYNQVHVGERDAFMASIVDRVTLGDHALCHAGDYKFPRYENMVSELPLVVEFAVRTGNADALFAAIKKIDFISRSHVLLLMQMEDILALKFNLFTDEQLQYLPLYLKTLSDLAESLTSAVQMETVIDAQMIKAIIDGIKQQCEQGRYYFLTGALRELPNLEIDQDKKRIETYLSALGFSPVMQKSLDEAEKDYRVNATEFELKNAMGHLRTFYEQLHFQVGHPLSESAGRAKDTKFGQVLTTLRVLDFFTEKDEKFAAALYGLLSDEAVHAFFAKKEYARLMRNVVIVYGVMFLSIMKGKGIKLGS